MKVACVGLYAFLGFVMRISVAIEASAVYRIAFNTFIETYAPNNERTAFDNLSSAQTACSNLKPTCGGITREPNGDYTLRQKSGPGSLRKSITGEVSWEKIESEDLTRSAVELLPDLASLISGLQ
mmetsp:Transcript_89395/g.178659  ORF Transcript_89395/g.178659 Transcript_89395/m.178659 type:complete len:125 (-) Transcript_89395:154-528(-)